MEAVCGVDDLAFLQIDALDLADVTIEDILLVGHR